MDTIIYQTDKVTFFILSQNTLISIVRKKVDVDFQKKPSSNVFT